ncbi:MAG: hypothetical protein KC656_09850, partial [Myxococcales bacterium]|nr:hypothetical protein [Myxococcales bacterium]
MLRLDATFDFTNPIRIEQGLTEAGWTDVLRIEVGDGLVYEDRQGIDNDLGPALAVVRERWLEGRTSYSIALGKPSGVLDLVAQLDVSPLGMHLRLSALDRQCEPREDEEPDAYRERVRTMLEQGWLAI